LVYQNGYKKGTYSEHRKSDLGHFYISTKSQSNIMEDHKPSIPKIFVSVISDDTSLKPIKILRDIGAPID
jgi:hypothetical protein